MTIKQTRSTNDNQKNLEGKYRTFVFLFTLTMVTFHLYTAIFGVLEALLQRSLHFTFGIVIIFLLHRAYSDRFQKHFKFFNLVDVILVILSLLSYGYIVINAFQLAERFPYITPLSNFQFVIGIIGVLIMIEACRRTVGIALPVIAVMFIIYAFAGPYLPGLLFHGGFDAAFVIDHLFFSPYGIFGRLAGPSSTFLFVFILFGSLLQNTGSGAFLIDIAMTVAGKRKGGLAKAAVIASGLMGTVIGSPLANVLTTGSLTIPIMKKGGYKPHYAAGVEAAASTGGQIMPPLMGTAAFMMAEMLGIAYLAVVKAALLPAILYYIALFIMVEYQTSKMDLKAAVVNDWPGLRTILLQKGEFILPALAIIYLLIAGYSPLRISTVAVISLLMVSYLRKQHRLKLPDLLQTFYEGAVRALPVMVTIGTASIVVSLVMLTGISSRVAQIMLNVSGESMLLSLFLMMVVSILLGLGLPTLPAYLIQVPIVVPALVQLGIEPLVAHFFILFFAVMSNITPPIAIVSIAAAGLAGADSNRTSLIAWKLASTAFIIPFMFVYGNALLMIGTLPEIILAFTTGALGCFALAGAMEGFLLNKKIGKSSRLLSLISGMALLNVNLITDLIGILLIGLALFLQQAHRSKTGQQEANQS